MNSKNIKKSLKAKLNRWIDSIEDEEVAKVVSKNTIITGGALVSLLTNDTVNDYDVYFRTKEALLKVVQYYVDKFNSTHKTNAFIKIEEEKIKIFIESSGVLSEKDDEEDGAILPEEDEKLLEQAEKEKEISKPKYRPIYLTSNAITLSDKIQIVIRFWGEVEEIHKNYDFAHCTCAWSSWDNKLSLPQKALECIINKELFYIGSKYPLCSIIRTRKFIKRGYTINAGQYLKMCMQLNELNLKNIEVLKDQLVGVDSAYFDRVINAIAEKKEKEPDWELENSYLFEIINRVF
jgi:hypothetical protein